jgi:hypothetical protein
MRNYMFVCTAIVLYFAGSAMSQYGGVGYSVFSVDSTMQSNDLKGPEIRFRFPINKEGYGLKFIPGFNLAYYWNGDEVKDPVWNLITLSPLVEFALHEQIGQSDFFFRPSIGIGGTLAVYESRLRTTSDIFDEKSETAFGWMGQVGITLGIENKIGVEVSYGLHELDFNDEADGTHSQLYIGLAFGF